MAEEARGDDDNDADGNSGQTSWCAECGWRPALRAADAMKCNSEEEQSGVMRDWQCRSVSLCLHVPGEGNVGDDQETAIQSIGRFIDAVSLV